MQELGYCKLSSRIDPQSIYDQVTLFSTDTILSEQCYGFFSVCVQWKIKVPLWRSERQQGEWIIYCLFKHFINAAWGLLWINSASCCFQITFFNQFSARYTLAWFLYSCLILFCTHNSTTLNTRSGVPAWHYLTIDVWKTVGETLVLRITFTMTVLCSSFSHDSVTVRHYQDCDTKADK